MFYPMFAMAALTFIVLIINFIWRVRAVRSRAVSIKYFRTFTESSENVPARLLAGSRHYQNLFELPVLFYVACLTAVTLNIYNVYLMALAWLFVAARCVHAVIHMSYNNVLHRMLAFWLGIISLAIMWVVLLLERLPL